MENVKFVKFGDLEEKMQKHIAKKFPGIKDSALIYCEHPEEDKKDLWEKLNDAYIVKNIEEDGLDIAGAWDGWESSLGMDEETEKALADAPKGFTIYGKEPAAEEAAAEEAAAEEPAEKEEQAADEWEEVEITRECGHKEMARIRRWRDEEEKEIRIEQELQKRPLCRECWEKAAKEEEKKAKKAAKEKRLPALKGSAKQKKWAEKIRMEKLNMLDRDPSMWAVRNYYMQITKASTWIDRRFMKGYELAEAMRFDHEEEEIMKRRLR